ncbi:hypothetical protein GCM10023339_73970 [Alloalcanivorax gelatiniphagus]
MRQVFDEKIEIFWLVHQRTKCAEEYLKKKGGVLVLKGAPSTNPSKFPDNLVTS